MIYLWGRCLLSSIIVCMVWWHSRRYFIKLLKTGVSAPMQRSSHPWTDNLNDIKDVIIYVWGPCMLYNIMVCMVWWHIWRRNICTWTMSVFKYNGVYDVMTYKTSWYINEDDDSYEYNCAYGVMTYITSWYMYRDDVC